MIGRFFPYPLLAAAVFLLWILLSGVSAGQCLLAAAAALLAPQVMRPLGPASAEIRWGRAVPRLVGLVLLDILRSNLAVARIVLFGSRRRSGFMEVPLELRNPYALTTLAVIITATPGTIWLQHDPDRQTVLIHVLDLKNEADWITLIKNRYERLLKEIFP
ncbi:MULTISPECIES: Na+/H+ antiporter subunit E [Sphingobium]|jgi:multicomponent K+:H+ antiporter subunit E|uniref:Na+/H+ antiporter subunit E n=1 Tax=Sphingobium TaxID=165695 RepID=UPI00257DF3E6|nr:MULTISPECIES: Na+/H+ antiporter subunit E [Sphingobium]MDV3482543.1 Na+/H+ antiporter subunit E [Sphingobium yanoikuyae]